MASLGSWVVATTIVVQDLIAVGLKDASLGPIVVLVVTHSDSMVIEGLSLVGMAQISRQVRLVRELRDQIERPIVDHRQAQRAVSRV